MVLCSATHDPYEVPAWFGDIPREPLERYRQAIFYTDKFLAALDVEMTSLNIRDETIFCIVGDHGEAFGEHGLLGHERIAFDEVLHIPFCLRVPFLVEAGRKVGCLASSIDVTPTLLGLLGFETEGAGFEGRDLFGPLSGQRKAYFCGWMPEGPAGFVQGSRKFIYSPASKTTSVYDLSSDPLERVRIELPEQRSREVADEIIAWRKSTILRLDQEKSGRKVLFDRWLCRWTNRVSSAKYIRRERD